MNKKQDIINKLFKNAVNSSPYIKFKTSKEILDHYRVGNIWELRDIDENVWQAACLFYMKEVAQKSEASL